MCCKNGSLISLRLEKTGREYGHCDEPEKER